MKKWLNIVFFSYIFYYLFEWSGIGLLVTLACLIHWMTDKKINVEVTVKIK